MKLVILRTKMDPKTEFKFKSIEDCEKFKYVFRDHMCNVSWEKPETVEVKSISSDLDKIISRNPARRAEDNLHWGFNLCRYHNVDITADQLQIIHGIMDTGIRKQSQ